MSKIKMFLKKYWCLIPIVICVFIFFFWFFPEIYIYSYFKYLTNKESLESIQAIRTLILQISAGILALVGIYLTWLRTRALDIQNQTNIDNFEELRKRNEQDKKSNNDNLILQQFSEASKLLANENNITARLSGIYLFEKIMNSSKEYHWQIIELLTAYIKEKRQIDGGNKPRTPKIDTKTVSSQVENDIQAILTVLGRRNRDLENQEKEINRKINLSDINLYKANFSQTNESNGHYENFDFSGSFLLNTNFYKCQLEGTYFIAADMNATILTRANMKNTKLNGAVLEDAYMFDSILDNSELHCTNLNFVNGLTIDQLSKVKTLYETKNLETKLKTELEQSFPQLFEIPFLG